MKSTGALPLVAALVSAFVIGLVSTPLMAGQQPAQPVVLQSEAAASVFWRMQNRSLSRDQAAAIVKRAYGGKILAIKEVNKNGRAMYRVKGLSKKSQVYVVYVDKQSGRISR